MCEENVSYKELSDEELLSASREAGDICSEKKRSDLLNIVNKGSKNQVKNTKRAQK